MPRTPSDVWTHRTPANADNVVHFQTKVLLQSYWKFIMNFHSFTTLIIIIIIIIIACAVGPCYKGSDSCDSSRLGVTTSFSSGIYILSQQLSAPCVLMQNINGSGIFALRPAVKCSCEVNYSVGAANCSRQGLLYFLHSSVLRVQLMKVD